MSPTSHKVSDFKALLRGSMGEILNSTTFKLPKHENVYFNGDQAKSVYFIESGQIKLLTLSPEGKECLLAIHTAGDTFGELCFLGSAPRQETATAMEETTLVDIPCAAFFSHLANHFLLEGFIHYILQRVAEQQQVISNLVTIDSEHRLGETLLLLARKLGRPDPLSTRIENKITHEELSQMVGTTRPRVTEFMRKFRELGLILTNADHFLVVRERRLSEYLARTKQTARFPKNSS